MRRIPRSPVSYADADRARRRRLPAKWLAAMIITAAVALLAPGATYVTAGRPSGLSAVCVTATESFGMSCVQFSAPAG